MAIANKIVEAVINRSKGYCEFCGGAGAACFHHRKLKSRGGKDSVSNLVHLHHRCHNLGTKSVHLNPKIATELGFMVSAWADPAEVAVTLPNGKKALLLENGNYKMLGEANELDIC
jgi:hypothetical protein